MAWPGTPHASTENALESLFNPSFKVNFSSEPARSRHEAVDTDSHENPLKENSLFPNADDMLQSTFDYLNRKLGFSNQDVSLKPMIGLDVFRSFTVAPGMTLTPEVYAIYRYESLDDNLPLFEHHSIQTGVGLAFNMSDTVSAHISWDSDILTGHDQRAALMMKYRW